MVVYCSAGRGQSIAGQGETDLDNTGLTITGYAHSPAFSTGGIGRVELLTEHYIYKAVFNSALAVYQSVCPRAGTNQFCEMDLLSL